MGRRNKCMDLSHVDRLSKLPDDILYHILSFLDIKYVVQTSTLSKRWMHIWKSVTRLNFDSYKFHTIPQFTRFVNNVLSKRNNCSQVSAVELSFRGPATEFVIESIVNYAYLHSVQKLTFIWFSSIEQDFPPYLFTCHTLKHLTLAVYVRSKYAGICHLPESPWDFPALETLNLSGVQFRNCEDKSANLFSKCVNLKELTLHRFKMTPLETFTICAPQLSSLTIKNAYCFPKVLNVVAPQLKNLTASIQSSHPFLRGDYLQLSAVRFDSIQKVSLSRVHTHYYNHEKLFDLFKKLHSAKFLILDMNIIQILSSCVDQLRLEPSPFNNLTCLGINATNVKPMEDVPVIPIEVRNYFLRNSLNSTFIMDSPPQLRHCWQISEKVKPHPMVISILTRAEYVIPRWKIVPTKDVIDAAFKDPLKREEIRGNKLIYQEKPRLKTALELLRTSMSLEDTLTEVTLPFFVLHGEADTVTDPEVSKALNNQASSNDKTIKLYPGMWHGLTAGETDDNIDIVFRDIISWLDKRSSDKPTSSVSIVVKDNASSSPDQYMHRGQKSYNRGWKAPKMHSAM